MEDKATDFGWFFDTNYHKVLGAVAATTGQAAAAEDATQEAFIRAYRRWDQLGHSEHAERWVVTTATRLGIDAWRHSRRSVPLTEGMLAPHTDEVERLWAKWGIAQLTPMERRAVMVLHWEGLTIREAAEKLGRSQNTIKTNIQRARAHLTLILGNRRKENGQ